MNVAKAFGVEQYYNADVVLRGKFTRQPWQPSQYLIGTRIGSRNRNVKGLKPG